MIRVWTKHLDEHGSIQNPKSKIQNRLNRNWARFARFQFAPRLSLFAWLGVLLLALASCGGHEKTAQSVHPVKEPLELSARVDRASVSPGDIVTFTVAADYAQGVSINLPEIADRLADFRIVNSGDSGPTKKGDRLLAERWYKLQADVAGSYTIEPIEVSYVQGGGAQKTLKTPKIFIEVVSLLGKEGEANDIRDIKPPLPAALPYKRVLLTLAALGAFVLLVLGMRWLVVWLRRRAEARKAASRLPHEEALEALEKLLKKRLIEKGREREFCFEISEIFRQYMQARFEIPAVDWTTDEILLHIDGNGMIEETLKPIVRAFLIDTDMAKFARHQPPREDLDRIIEDTRSFISRTKLEHEFHE
ncbi:hypothetical protein HZA56_05580 [Candidatus Poribacteria bacterium]|nr:hypothetical protein [Candidatus Poribacteria bacterium]